MANESFLCVPVDTDLYLEVVRFLEEEGVERDPNDVIDQFIRYGLDNASWKQEVFFPELFVEAPPVELKGYTWGKVFLPHGTAIRMKYKREFHYAKVDGDQIIYQGKPVSPSQFANTVTQTNRNAWRDIWIRRPGDDDWIAAADLRPPPPKITLEDF